MEKIRKFLKEEEGVIAVEYALLTGLIGLGLYCVIFTWAGSIANLFYKLTNLGNGINFNCASPGQYDSSYIP